MTGWWRRNRIGLALVPVALVGALAGNASRLNDYWWAIDLHTHQSAGADGVVHFRDHFDDGHVRYPIEADISLVSVKRATGVTIDGASHPVSIPDDSQLWEVTTHWVADPAIALDLCTLGIEGTDGRYWERSQPDPIQVNDAVIPYSACAPDATPGPIPPIPPKTQLVQPAPKDARPRSYDVTTWVVTAKDAVPGEIRIWWVKPAYAALPVR